MLGADSLGQPPSYQPTEQSLAKRAVVSTAKGTIMVPLNVVALIPKVGSVAADPLLMKLLAGAGYVVAGTVHTVFSKIEKAIDAGHAARALQGAIPAGRHIVDASTGHADAVRSAQSDTAQGVLTGVKWGGRVFTSILPGFVTTMTEAGTDALMTIEKGEKKFSEQNTALWRKAYGGLFELVKMGASPLFWIVKKAIVTPVRYAAEPIKNHSLRVWHHPERPQEALQNLSDRLDSYSSSIWHCFTTVHDTPVIQQKKPLPAATEATGRDVTAFRDASNDTQNDILYCVLNTKSHDISQALVTKLTKAVDALKKGKATDEIALQQLMAIYKALPPNEKEILTPSIFNRFEEAEKLKLYSIVQTYSKLTADERALLLSPQLRHVHAEGDWGTIPQELRLEVESLILQKFNSLPAKHKEKMLSLSIDQFRELTLENKKLLFSAIEQKIDEGHTSRKESRNFDYVAHRASGDVQNLTDDFEIKPLLKLYDGLFSKEEKFSLLAQFAQNAVFICPTTKDELDSLIHEQQQKLYTVSGDEQEQVKKLVNWLIEQRDLFKAREAKQTEQKEPQRPVDSTQRDTAALDLAKIDAAIGLGVGPLEVISDWAGSAGRVMVAGSLGVASWTLLKGVGYIVKPHGIQIAKDSPLRNHSLFKPLITSDGYLRFSKGASTFENWVENVVKLSATAVDTALLVAPVLPLLMPLVPVLAPLAGVMPYVGYAVGSIPLVGGALRYGGGFASTAGSYAVSAMVEVSTQGAIEQALRAVPATVAGGLVSALPAAARALETVQAPVSALAKQILELKSLGDAAQKIPGSTQAVREWNERSRGMRELLTQTTKEMCRLPEEAGKLFVCNSEVALFLQQPYLWEEYAQIIGVPPNSKEFFESLTSTLRTGKAPWAADSIEESSKIAEALRATNMAKTLNKVGVKTQVATGGIKSWLAESAPAKWLSDTRWAKMLGSWSKAGAIVDTATGTSQKLANAKEKVEDTLGAMGESIKTGATSAAEAVKELFGQEQKIPEKIATYLNLAEKTQVNLAKAEAAQQQATLAMDVLNNFYDTHTTATSYLLETQAAQSAAKAYVEGVEPQVKEMALALNAAYHIAHGSQQFLEAQVKAEGNMLGDLTSEAMTTLGAKSLTLLSKEEQSAKGSTVGAGLSILANGTSLMKLASGRFLILPEVLRLLAVPLARTTAPHIAPAAQDFLYSLADQSYAEVDKAGTWFHEKSKGVGAYGQSVLGWLAAGRYVFNQRVDNFLQLSKQEQQHLIAVATDSNKLQQTDQLFLQKNGPQVGKNILTLQDEKKVARLTLLAYDKLATYEKLNISPSYYDSLAPEKQERIIDLVQQKVGLSAIERQNKRKIIEKFNSLPIDSRKEVDILSVWEFGKMTSDQKDDILFAITHSQAFRETKYEGDETTFSLKRFHKLKAGLANKDLAKLLSLYSTLEPHEKALLTPASLAKESTTKILQTLQIVKTYRSDLVAQFKYNGLDLDKLESALLRKERNTSDDIPARAFQEKRLLETLASCFNELRPQQKSQFLLFTAEEFSNLSKEEQVSLISFLIAQPQLESSLDLFKEMLVKLDSGDTVNSKSVVSRFNSLETIVQASFRNEQTRSKLSKDTLISTCEKKLNEIADKIDVYNKRLGTNISRFSGLQIRYENVRKERDEKQEKIQDVKKKILECKTNIAKNVYKDKNTTQLSKLEQEEKQLGSDFAALQKQLTSHLQSFKDRASLIDSQETERAALIAEFSALKQFLPEQNQRAFAGIDASPMPPEWHIYMQDAITLTLEKVGETQLEAHLQVLRKFSTDPKQQGDYITVVGQQQQQIKNCIEIEKKKKADKIAEVETLTKDLANPNLKPEEKVEIRMKIAFIKTFYYKLHDESCFAYNKLSIDLNEQETALRKIKYPT